MREQKTKPGAKEVIQKITKHFTEQKDPNFYIKRNFQKRF